MWKLIIFLPVVISVFIVREPNQQQIGCRNPQGQVVEWFAIITTPQTVHKNDPASGFLYYDSTMTSDTFTIFEGYGNEEDQPIGRTVAQVDEFGLNNLVWNDQLNPAWGLGYGSSTKAHSKGYLALSSDKNSGFLMDHSVPKYPFVNNDSQVTREIEDSQRLKAQHHFCLTITDSKTAKEIISNTCFMKPEVYQKGGIATCVDDKSTDYFRHLQVQLSSSTIKAVYKNGYSRIVNEKGKKVPYESEIFRDGVAPMVQSSIIAQTFGSPDATAPFCSGLYSVGNSYEMKVADNTWKQGSDHCKWAYALDSPYACFGDLNRNTYAQTVRGGAFYCINSSHLRNALQSINPSPQTC